MTTISGAAFLLAFVVSYALTPLVREWSRRIGFVDRPDGGRKLQKDAVALGGGIALLITTPFVACLLFKLIGPDIYYSFFGYPDYQEGIWMLVGLSAAAAVLGVVGLVDDSIGMKGSHKLMWQMVAAMLVAGSGGQITFVSNLTGGDVQLGILGGVVTVIWLLGSINSFNLIDGVDGLAGSIGVVFSLALGVIAVYKGQVVDAIIVFALAGAILGFLRFNYAPASIYLGDTGSMFIGLLLGTLALRSSTKQAATMAFSVPLAIWAIPIFDSLAAVLRRKLTGRSIYTTDRGHFHHVLLTRGLNAGQAVFLITLLCAATSGAAVVSVVTKRPWIGIATTGAVIAGLVLTRVFGHVEFLLLNSRLLGFGRYLSPAADNQSRVTLQGSRQCEEFWGGIVAQADRFLLTKISLTLSLPALQEDFYANWHKSEQVPTDQQWQVEIPLYVNEAMAGRLKLSGLESPNSHLSDVIEFVNEMRQRLQVRVRKQIDDQNTDSLLEAGENVVDLDVVAPKP